MPNSLKTAIINHAQNLQLKIDQNFADAITAGLKKILNMGLVQLAFRGLNRPALALVYATEIVATFTPLALLGLSLTP